MADTKRFGLRYQPAAQPCDRFLLTSWIYDLGTYGKVHLVRHRQTGQTAAAKIATIAHAAQLQDFAVEIDILTGCR